MVLGFIVYFFGVILAMQTQIVCKYSGQPDSSEIRMREAFKMLCKSFGSWFTVFAVIKNCKR